MYNQLSQNLKKLIQDKYKKLDKDTETSLITLAKTGNQEAKNKLLYSQLPFIAKCARIYSRVNCHIDDLFQVGCMATINEAITNFDETKEVRFQSYLAYQLKDKMTMHRYQECELIPVPMNHIRQYEAKRKEMKAKKDYEGLSKLETPFVSIDGIDTPITEDGFTLADVLSDESADLNNIMYNSEREKIIEKMIKGLDTDEQSIINKFYGFNGNKLSGQDIAQSMNTSRQVINLKMQRIHARLRETKKLALI